MAEFLLNKINEWQNQEEALIKKNVDVQGSTVRNFVPERDQRDQELLVAPKRRGAYQPDLHSVHTEFAKRASLVGPETASSEFSGRVKERTLRIDSSSTRGTEAQAWRR